MTKTPAPPVQTSWPASSARACPTLHFTGQVVQVVDNQLTFADQTGVQRQAMLGPPWWWSENGIELEGFESPDHMEVNWIQNLRTGERLDLRTPEGMPVWAQ